MRIEGEVCRRKQICFSLKYVQSSFVYSSFCSSVYPSVNPSYPSVNPSYPSVNPSYPSVNPSYPSVHPSYPPASYPSSCLLLQIPTLGR